MPEPRPPLPPCFECGAPKGAPCQPFCTGNRHGAGSRRFAYALRWAKLRCDTMVAQRRGQLRFRLVMGAMEADVVMGLDWRWPQPGRFPRTGTQLVRRWPG